MKIVLAIATLALVTGCGAPEGGVSAGSLGDLKAYKVPLPDGGAVVCVVYDGYQSGGISCDWSE